MKLFIGCIAFVCITFFGHSQDCSEYGIFDNDWLPATFHKKKREALRAQLPHNSVLLVFAAPRKKRSNDIFYTYHPDPDFYYLTGYREPNAGLILFKESTQVDSIRTDELLFVQSRKKQDEIWDGKRLGVVGACKILGFEHVRPSSTFPDIKLDLSKFDHVYILTPDHDPEDDPRNRGDLASMLKHFNIFLERDSVEASIFAAKEYMARLRQIKSEDEINLIRKACEITCVAHNELMRAFRAGMSEFQAQAIIEYCFGIHGAEKRGFPSICGSGDNACILHYSSNRKITEKNELMLVDIGAEYRGYTADVTRTFPVSGKFTYEQKKIYNLVLQAQRKGIEKCHPGAKFSEPHDRAKQVIAQGLMRLGIIKEYKDLFRYYMHGTSHYMGLDVHDSGLYGAFETGQVVTVEPGIYIPEGSDCDERWWGIGIRIEDDILITKYGNEILTDDSPVTVEEIEALMKEESKYFKPLPVSD